MPDHGTARRGWWVLMLLLGFGLRLVFVFHQPFTNDEGSYLYDAKTLLEGRLPAGDVLTKTPAVAGTFLLAVWLADGSLFAARFASAFMNTLTAAPLAALGASLFGRRAGRAAGLVWLFAAGPATFAAFGQTEAAAGFFGVSTLALWAQVLRARPSSGTGTLANIFVAVGAGTSFALAFAARKSSVVLIPLVLALLWRSARFGRGNARRMLPLALLGVSLMFVPWLFLAHRLYGSAGVREALGIGYGTIIAGHLDRPDHVGSWAGGPYRALAVGLWTAGPLLALAAVGLGATLARHRRRWDWADPRAIPLLWLAALGFLYALWPTLLPDYLPEAFPAVILLAVMGAGALLPAITRAGAIIVGSLLLAWNIAILADVYRAPWTGMFTADAVRGAASQVERLVPPEEPLFTAALLVPYLSGHRVLFDIAHPVWYRLPFIPPEVHRTFLPPLADVEDAVRTKVRWALVEHFTDYAYLRHPSDLLSVIWSEFTFVREIPNETGYRSNPLLLWERVDSMLAPGS